MSTDSKLLSRQAAHAARRRATHTQIGVVLRNDIVRALRIAAEIEGVTFTALVRRIIEASV